MVTCNFLGNSYSFSQDIFDIHAIYACFSDEQSKILAVLEKLASTVEKPGMVDENGNDEIVDAFRASATRIVTSLCDKGIVSYTVSDFLDKNTAYAKYQELAVNTAKAYMEIIMNTAMSFMNQTMAARDSAASTITGTGTGIITNSMASLLVYDAIEAKTINKQIASAEAAYKENLNRISDRSDRKQAEAEQNYKFHKWLPAAQELIYEFVSYNLDQYLQIMCSSKKIRAESVKLIDAARSNELLGNCELTQNKKAVLAQAFQANPFNIEVYKNTLSFGFFTSDELNALKVFGLEPDFKTYLNELEKKSISIPSDVPIENRISFLSSIYSAESSDCDFPTYLSKKLSDYKNWELKQYKALVCSYGSQDGRKDWVHSNIASDIDSLATFSDEGLRSRIETQLCYEEQKLSIDVLLAHNIATKDEVSCIREKNLNEIYNYCINARNKYLEYSALSNEYNSKSVPLQNNLDSYRSSLSACAFYQLKEKRYYRERITQITKELETLKPLADKVAQAKSCLPNL